MPHLQKKVSAQGEGKGEREGAKAGGGEEGLAAHNRQPFRAVGQAVAPDRRLLRRRRIHSKAAPSTSAAAAPGCFTA